MTNVSKTNQQFASKIPKTLSQAQRLEKGFFRYYLEKVDKPAAALLVTVTAVTALWLVATGIYNSRHDDKWMLIPPEKIGVIFKNGGDTTQLQAPGSVEK